MNDELDRIIEARHRHLLQVTEQAFATHRIQDRGDGRFRIMRPHKDGGWDSIYWAEIFVGWAGALYVGGDIDTVTFAYGPKDSMARLRWIGNHTDVDSYIAEKASIGSGRESIRVFDAKVATAQVRSWLHEWFAERGEKYDTEHSMVIDVEEALSYHGNDGPDLLYSAIDDATNRLDPNFLEDRHGIGMVLAPHVYLAWGAIRRLVQLLEEQRLETHA